MFRDGGGSNPGDGAAEEWGLSQDDPHTGDNMTQTQDTDTGHTDRDTDTDNRHVID